jgi:chloride channel protein, CIC family
MDADIPPTLRSRGAVGFWAAVILTGTGAGIGAVALTTVLETVQHLVWPGPNLLDAATHASAWRHVWVLLGAGLCTGAGQVVLRRLTSGNGIDITEAISECGGRLPALRTLGTAVLSIVVVGMGASLGREGAPKQVGAVLANALSERAQLSDEQRRLLWPAALGLEWRPLTACHWGARCSLWKCFDVYWRYG